MKLRLSHLDIAVATTSKTAWGRALVLIASLILAVTFTSERAHASPNDSLLAQIDQRSQATHSDSLVISQDGTTIESTFAKPDEVKTVQSITKSICAMAVARLIDQGKIKNFDEPMSTWIPEWKQDALKSQITLKQILNHTSGLPDVETHKSDSGPVKPSRDYFAEGDLVKAAIAVPLVGTPGGQFLYSSIAYMLVQPVIAQASGQSVSDYIDNEILAKIAITDETWSKDKVGHEITSGGLHLSTADLLKIGTLVMNHSHAVLSPAADAALMTRSQTFRDYGLGWWLSQDEQTISARGYGGQFIVISPLKKLLAVRTRTIDPAGDIEADTYGDFPDLLARWQ